MSSASEHQPLLNTYFLNTSCPPPRWRQRLPPALCVMGFPFWVWFCGWDASAEVDSVLSCPTELSEPDVAPASSRDDESSRATHHRYMYTHVVLFNPSYAHHFFAPSFHHTLRKSRSPCMVSLETNSNLSTAFRSSFHSTNLPTRTAVHCTSRGETQ